MEFYSVIPSDNIDIHGPKAKHEGRKINVVKVFINMVDKGKLKLKEKTL